MFWKSATSLGALASAIGSAVFSISFKYLLPGLPFMDRISLVFLLCLAATVVVSLLDKPSVHDSSVSLKEVSFVTDTGFNIAAIGCVFILVCFYVTWW